LRGALRSARGLAPDGRAERLSVTAALARTAGLTLPEPARCKDRWGFSWQITPRQLLEGMADPDRVVAKRVFEAMMTMRKIDVARIEAARRGEG
jgi:predicted 3-demethylubiquinone-9 3-methyltransferase (glyoxalase superfamily)